MDKNQRAILKRLIKIHMKSDDLEVWVTSGMFLSRYGIVTITKRNGIWNIYLKDKEVHLFGDFNKMFDYLCEKLK